MPDKNRLGDENEINPNEATEDGETQTIQPGTGGGGEGTAGTTGTNTGTEGTGGDTSGTGR